MSSFVRVTNVPNTASLETIQSLFLSFGNIIEITDGKNFVDIQFQDIEDAQASIDNMNGYKLFDKYLQVSRLTEYKRDSSNQSYRLPIWADQEQEPTDN